MTPDCQKVLNNSVFSLLVNINVYSPSCVPDSPELTDAGTKSSHYTNPQCPRFHDLCFMCVISDGPLSAACAQRLPTVIFLPVSALVRRCTHTEHSLNAVFILRSQWKG